MSGPDGTSDAVQAPAPSVPAGPPRISSEQLLGGAREVLIEHEGETYRLQRTRAGKLILTK
jgi:hemin uptake protein HemP